MSIVSLNRVTLTGTVASLVKISENEGIREASFGLITSEHWKENNIPKSRNEYHNIIVADEVLSEIAEGHLTKGMNVHLEGMLSRGFVVLRGPRCILQLIMSSGQKAPIQQYDR